MERIHPVWRHRPSTANGSDAAVERVQAEIAATAEREGLDLEFEQIMRVDAAPVDGDCIDTVVGACETVGCEYSRLVSGAGHDAT